MYEYLNHATFAWMVFLALLFFGASTDVLIRKICSVGQVSNEVVKLFKWAALIVCAIDLCAIIWLSVKEVHNLFF
jgi:hypothetical protein